MISLILIYIGVSVFSAFVLVYFMVSAPKGWEDEKGFHISERK